ncbi:hypothetical protein MMC29_008383 [Sticta canariensis]|nr:hypothetical protein [Sticta canariensis]
MSTIRRPFQPLGELNLRRLANTKNFQNAIVPPTTDNSLKRPHEPSSPDEEDQENLDPISLPPSKKSKSGLEDSVQSKTALFMFTNGGDKTAAPTARPKRPLPASPRYTLVSKPSLTVSTSLPIRAGTARVPAGRSPVKRIGLMSHRRKVSRINPPSLCNGDAQGASLPFSLDAALSGTVSSYTPQAETKVPLMLDNSIPASWKFTIYEETECQQKDTILAHSTNILDISDDEGGLGAKDHRGKENIPPTDALITTEMPASRWNKMDDLPRTPLGGLDPAHFYAEGFDASSHFLVPAEKDEL